MNALIQAAYSRRVSAAIGALMIAVSLFYLVRWLFGPIGVMSVPDSDEMKSATAVCFLLFGILLTLRSDSQWKMVPNVIAGTIALIALVVLIERVFNITLGIDEFFSGQGSDLAVVAPTEMPAIVAVLFLASVVCFVLLRSNRFVISGHVILFAVIAIALFTIAEHLYGVNEKNNPVDLTKMSLVSTLMFICMSHALACVQPRSGLFGYITNDTTSGKMTRILLPAAILTPLIVGWLRIRGEDAGLFDNRFGVALVVISNIMIICIVTLIIASRYHQLELKQSQTAEQIKQERKLFRALIENSGDAIALQDRDMNFLYRSPSAERVTGWSTEERKKLGWEDHIHPEDRDTLRAAVSKALNTPEVPVHVTFRTLHKSGRYVWMDGTMINLFDNPAIQGLVSNYKDITAQKHSEEQTHRGEQLYRTIAASMPGAVVLVIDHNERYLLAEGEAIESLGYIKEEMEGKTLREVLKPESYPTIQSAVQRVLAGEKFATEIQSQGSDFYVQFVPLRDNEGQIYAAMVLGIDITAIKTSQRKERALADDLQLKNRELFDYRYALDESAIVAITDQTGKITHVNKNFCDISGYTEEELIGQNHSIINSAFHSAEFIRELWTTIANGKIWRGEIRNKAKDGHFYWVDTTIVPFLNAEGKPYQYLAIRSDITARRVFAEQLQEANHLLKLNGAKLKEAQAIAHVGNWEVDLIRNTSTWSDEAFRIFNLQPGEITPSPQTFLQFVHPDDHAYAERTIEEVYKNLQDSSFYLRVLLRDGTIKNCYLEWRFEFNADRIPVRAFGIIQDVTERTRNEASLKAVNKDLETFIYRAAHDLRGPLSSVMGMVGIGIKEVKDEFSTKLFGMIGDSTRKLDRTLSGLVQSMNIKDTKSFSDKIDFGKLIDESIEKFTHYEGFERMSINVEVNCKRELISNRSILESVFQNIIENTIKYQNYSRQPRLNITITENQYEHKIVFEDNGIGIRTEHIEQIFDMYFRATSTVAGTGLGLYIVKTGIDKLRGRIQVTSTPGIGTKFTIHLPD